MKKLIIKGRVKSEAGCWEPVQSTIDLEEVLEQTAKDNGVKGKVGSLWRHLDPQVESVELSE